MEDGNVGSYEIIDLDLARYDVLAERPLLPYAMTQCAT